MTALAPNALTLAEAMRIVAEATKDKSYREYPLGQEAGHYLRHKRKRLTDASYRDYESCLDKLARRFPTLELHDFAGAKGVELIEEFLEHQWGPPAAGRTYNKNHSILSDFFKWAVIRDKLAASPLDRIEKAKKRGVHRTTFTDDQRLAIIAAADNTRDRLALRLLLDYGIRKGSLKSIQFKHFDHNRRTLTIFTKGQKVRSLRIVSTSFWHELDKFMLETEAQPNHYLVPSRRVMPRLRGVQWRTEEVPLLDRPLSDHGLHNWWYRRLAAAGVVDAGTTSGERMHKARHTAGQRVLNKTGNLKAAQKLLGHEDIGTTGNIYTDWDEEALAETMRLVLGDDDE